MVGLLAILDEPVIEIHHTHGTIRFDADVIKGLLERRWVSSQGFCELLIAAGI